MKKETVRESMRFLRRNMTENERKEKDAAIRNRLYELDQFKNASIVFPFVSFGTEVDTVEIIKRLFGDGRKVAVPRVQGDEMDFYLISSMTGLERGTMGILEPVSDRKVKIEEGVMLLPGLAFDIKKNRAGYGGGYYDRYLAKHTCEGVYKIALAYDFQIVNDLEAEKHDKKPDMILTEKRVIV